MKIKKISIVFILSILSIAALNLTTKSKETINIDNLIGCYNFKLNEQSDQICLSEDFTYTQIKINRHNDKSIYNFNTWSWTGGSNTIKAFSTLNKYKMLNSIGEIIENSITINKKKHIFPGIDIFPSINNNKIQFNVHVPHENEIRVYIKTTTDY